MIIQIPNPRQQANEALIRECDYATDEDVCILVSDSDIERLHMQQRVVQYCDAGGWVPVKDVRELVYRNARHHMFD